MLMACNVNPLPNVGIGGEGSTSSRGQGARGRWQRPVRRRGWARWRIQSGWSLTMENDVGAATVGNVECEDECPPPLVLRTAPKYGNVGWGEGDNMAGGFGKVVVGRAGASYAMSLMLARSREVVRDRIADIVASSVALCCRHSSASRSTASSAACAAAS